MVKQLDKGMKEENQLPVFWETVHQNHRQEKNPTLKSGVESFLTDTFYDYEPFPSPAQTCMDLTSLLLQFNPAGS